MRVSTRFRPVHFHFRCLRFQVLERSQWECVF